MHMTAEKDPEETIANEEALIRKLAGLNEHDEIAFSDIGWTSRVYVVNSGEVVFKFPREESVKAEYALEVQAYKIAREIGGVLIPDVQWQDPDMNYMGYRGIVGKQLDTVLPTLSIEEKRTIGAQLGRFLAQFHQRELPGAPVMTQEKEFAEYEQKLQLALPEIKKHFLADEIGRIQRLVLEEYPRKMRELGFKKGLCHADLGYWNLIYSPGAPIGIIDFGDTGYYDTSVDFAGMNDGEILRAALEAAQEDIAAEKIALRMKIIPVADLPFFAGKKDESGIQRTIDRIRMVTLA